MIQATIGFIVYGVHKDGLKDPMGTPFMDDALVQRAKSSLVAAGLKSSSITLWSPANKKLRRH